MSANLQEILSDVHGTAILSIDTITVPKLTGGKDNPMKDKVRKITIGSNVMVFAVKGDKSAYESMVKRRLAQEGKDPDSFKVSERKWGEHVPGTPFIQHNGELYLEVVFLRPGQTKYMHGVREIEKDQIIGLPSTAMKEDAQAGLDNKVQYRTIKVDSISAITYKGQHIVLW